MSLKQRIAEHLGWSSNEVNSFSWAALRDLVRNSSPKLASAITEAMKNIAQPSDQR